MDALPERHCGPVPALEAIAVPLTGVLGRVILVACAAVFGLLLLDALFSGLTWVLTDDRRALADALGFLAEAAVALTATVAGAYGRARLRRVFEVQRGRQLVKVSS